jgi:hypothetical protein
MPAAMAGRTNRMGGLRNGTCGSIAQVCREHQHQRGNDAEREKCVQSRQDASQVACRSNGKAPRNRASSETGQRRDRARTGRDFEPRPALWTLDIVRACRCFRRRNFRLAMRTHANSHASPPSSNAYNNRIGGLNEREKPAGSPQNFTAMAWWALPSVHLASRRSLRGILVGVQRPSFAQKLMNFRGPLFPLVRAAGLP